MNDERIFYELSRGNGYSKMRCSDERVDIFFSFFMMERLQGGIAIVNTFCGFVLP